MIALNTLMTQPQKGEHLGPDGLIYCDTCKKARQIRLCPDGRTRLVRCLCPCQQAQRDGRLEELHRQEEFDRFSRLRSMAMQDPALRKCTFATSQYNPSARKTAENYVNQWPRMEKDGMGLLIWGDVGTGKTYLAACIANALLDQGVPVMMTSFGRILGAMPGPVSGEQTATVDNLMRYPLLILDDLGVERDSPYALEQIYHIVDARYRSGKPMIITTNLGMNQLENPDTQEKARIYDRVLERCIPLLVSGQHVRAVMAASNREAARERLR